MSFWQDDDNIYASSQAGELASPAFGTSQLSQSFVCEFCRGTVCIEDEDKLVCASCFADAQQTQGQYDYEDVLGLAARRQGRVVQSSRPSTGTTTGARVSKRQPLEDLDESRALPALEDCLKGFQRVLKEMTLKLCLLLDLDYDVRPHVEKTTKALWFHYLEAWREGAEYYGELHQDIRFSLRDAFLNGTTLVPMLLRHLAYKAQKKVQAEYDAKVSDNTKDGQISTVSDNTGKEESTRPPPGTSLQRGGSVRVQSLPPIEKMLAAETKFRRKGPKEVALMIKPSMNMVAAMLWLATLPYGVPSYRILGWIAGGSLPLCNTFGLLTEKEQKTLQPIRPIFCLSSIPTLEYLERLAERLAVVGRLNAWSTLTGSQSSTSFAAILPKQVPRVLEQMTRDVGLGSHVRDTAWALCGAAPPSHMALTKCENVDRLSSAAALIVCAYVLCDTDGGTWSIVRQPGLPWNDDQAVTNGSLRDHCLDFWEHLLSNQDTGKNLAPRLMVALEEHPSKRRRPASSRPITLHCTQSTPNTPLQRRLLQVLNRTSSRWERSLATQHLLTDDQRLLVELLAHEFFVSPDSIWSSLDRLLSLS